VGGDFYPGWKFVRSELEGNYNGYCIQKPRQSLLSFGFYLFALFCHRLSWGARDKCLAWFQCPRAKDWREGRIVGWCRWFLQTQIYQTRESLYEVYASMSRGSLLSIVIILARFELRRQVSVMIIREYYSFSMISRMEAWQTCVLICAMGYYVRSLFSRCKVCWFLFPYVHIKRTALFDLSLCACRSINKWRISP